MSEQTIKVGIGVLIFDSEKRLLLGKRKSAHGEGTWCPPGGHIEYGESFEEAAIRETKEETGIDIKNSDLQIIGVTNDFFKESGKHYVTIMMKALDFCGIPEVKEFDKCYEWRWFNIDGLPDNLFLSLKNFLNRYHL